jgi:hypothetical protein
MVKNPVVGREIVIFHGVRSLREMPFDLANHPTAKHRVVSLSSKGGSVVLPTLRSRSTLLVLPLKHGGIAMI